MVFATGVLAVLAACAFACGISMLAARATGRQAIRIHRLVLVIVRSPFCARLARIPETSPRRARLASAPRPGLASGSCGRRLRGLLLFCAPLLRGHCRLRRLEADLRVCPVAERFPGRRAAAAQRHGWL